ncbi:alpha/beta fold hydrolase [Alteromonas sp. H39]|uniref:alpha/beta fold hydrolase n=1 Tax=Alteromonas sp. H39 TaxID=3389876 RepID=UPI0039E1B0E1
MSIASHHEQFAELSNGTTLCYSEHGDKNDPAVILIAGLGLQMVYWPASFIQALTTAGFRVICYDNRDAGRSSRSNTPHPSTLQQLLGKAPKECYGLEHMADDTALLLTRLDIGQAHVVGMSMGGMIAQTLSYRHPEKVASLTSIFSTTGNRRVGQPAASTLWRLARAKSPNTHLEAIDNYCEMMNHIGDKNAPHALLHWQQYAKLAWQRNGSRSDTRALQRQIGAIMRSGDRTQALAKIKAPALIIHGDVDHMVHPSGGEATARAIGHARHIVIEGMRHQIDSALSHRLAQHILDHIQTGASDAA